MGNKINRHLILSLLLFFLLPLQAQTPQLSNDAKISLLTVSPSDDAVYTVYGHSALRVQDAAQKIDAVFNYDVPLENEYYVHRIGRTGRAKRRGVAYTLVSDYPSGMRLDGIAKFTGNEVKKAHLDAEGKLVED